jgi:LuxR family maltose regulon positive regulatory protein
MRAAELRRTEPKLELRLHRRASAWHQRHGDVPRAIEHALAAHDDARAGELLWSIAAAYSTGARNRELGAWLGRLDDARIAERPTLALCAAVHQLAAGDRDAAERWADAAERSLTAAGDDASAEASLHAGLATVRAGLARGGAEALLAESQYARTLAGAGVWRSPAALLEGAARRLLGAPGAARSALAVGARGGAAPTPSVRALALALIALLELEEGGCEAGLALAETAVSQLATAGLEDEPGGALVYAAAACARAQAGRVEQAREDADRGARMLAALGDAAPWYAAETHIALGRGLLRLSDAADARGHLTAAGRMLRPLPDAPGLRSRLDEAWERADSFAIGAVAGPSALTIAELRVLRFLPSHLSFREIAERLHVSANTVKTQAHAVYRKLDASSRSEAVARAGLIGLIDT